MSRPQVHFTLAADDDNYNNKAQADEPINDKQTGGLEASNWLGQGKSEVVRDTRRLGDKSNSGGRKEERAAEEGEEDEEDEWIDASGSVSPNHSRKPSITGEYTIASVLGNGQAAHIRTQLQLEKQRSGSVDPLERKLDSSPSFQPSSRYNSHETPTIRLLKRSQSYCAPPIVSHDIASTTQTVGMKRTAYENGGGAMTVQYETPPQQSRGSQMSNESDGGELTSRFMVSRPGSGPNSQPDSQGSLHRSTRRSGLSNPGSLSRSRRTPGATDDEDDCPGSDSEPERALAPRTTRWTGHPSDKYRTQLKLELQRASSVMEPGQAVGRSVSATGISPLVGMMGTAAGYDDCGGGGVGGGSVGRDPHLGRILERTGMEYRVVRRYMNPVARSLGRLAHMPGGLAGRPIRWSTPAYGQGDIHDGAGEAEELSPTGFNRASADSAEGAGEVEADYGMCEGDGEGGMAMDGSGILGEPEGMAVALRGLWERPVELGVSQ